ncbi:MAG: 16S rRNA (adenine(1518)-N(6)/adenine(1519)-N(6))-dimethyltransferase RsmA [Oscillospiraceae bacterium]
MQKLSNIGVIKDILTRYGFAFSKGLGQNFLVNPSICPRMAEQCGAKSGVGVIEIGAGIGVLTAELCQRAEKVVCIEIDQRLLPILEETVGHYTNLHVINKDILKVDLKQLIAEEFVGINEIVVCANLPYYLTSPIIMGLLEAKLPIASITVMVQKEAALRLCAKPGSREVGAITMGVHYHSQPHLLFHVSRGSFMPAPNVDSAVIRLDVLKNPSITVLDEAIFFQVIKGSFAQRRKIITNSLCTQFGLDKATMIALLDNCGISPNARPEALTMDHFGRIADEIKNAQKGL